MPLSPKRLPKTGDAQASKHAPSYVLVETRAPTTNATDSDHSGGPGANDAYRVNAITGSVTSRRVWRSELQRKITPVLAELEQAG